MGKHSALPMPIREQMDEESKLVAGGAGMTGSRGHVKDSPPAKGPVTIAVIPGDGIGREVMPAALMVLDEVSARFDINLEYRDFPDWSCDHYLRTGRMMPEDGLVSLSECDAILLGAVGDPRVPDHESLWGLLIPIRREFHQRINLRPIRLLDGVAGPLRDVRARDIDIVVVRENSEGEYTEVGGRLWRGEASELALQVAAFSRSACAQVVRYAFSLAEGRRKHLVAATKSNGIVHTMPFWDEIVREEGERFSDVRVEIVHVDALAARFVTHPTSLDVVVASNLFGDILSEIGAALVGSIGVAASANLNPTGEQPSMFEPVHGSAPDIAGRGVANPIGQILSASMMLQHLGYIEAASLVRESVSAVTSRGTSLPPDLGGHAQTHEVTREIVAEIREARLPLMETPTRG